MTGKKTLIKAGAAVVVPVALLLFVVRPLWEARLNKLDMQISESSTLLKRYAKKGKALPSREILEWSLKRQEALGERYDIVVNHLDPIGLELPPGTREPGLHFREKLYMVKKNLEQKAKEANSSLPENLGFSDALPDAQEVPTLLRELDVTNRIAEILLSEGVSDISLLRPLGREEPTSEEGVLGYRVVSIQVTFRSDVKSLVGILHSISSASPLLVTRDVQMKELSKSMVETDLIVSNILTEKREG